METINKQTVILDIKKNAGFSTPQFIQNDTNILEFIVKDGVDDADLSNVGRIVANFKRPNDGKIVSRLLNAEGNKVTYAVGLDEMVKSGYGELEIQFFSADNSERISTTRFKVGFAASIGTDVIYDNDGDLTLLQELFVETDEAKNKAEHAGDYANQEALNANTQAKNAQTRASEAEKKITDMTAKLAEADDMIFHAENASQEALGAATSANAAATLAKTEGTRAKAEADRLEGTDVSVLDNKLTAVTSQLAETNRQSQVLTHGTQVINADQSSPLNVEFYGNTLVNLLGKDGNFETDSNGDGVADGWGKGASGNVTLETTNVKYGTKAQKISALPGDSSATSRYLRKLVSLNAGKYYITLVDLITDGTSIGRLNIYDGVATDYGTQSATNKTLYTKLTFTEAKTVFLEVRNASSLVSTGWVQFDGVRIYEIDKSTYDKIGVSMNDVDVEKMFPYVESVQHLQNPYVMAEGDNLIAPLSASTTLHDRAAITSPYELTITPNSTYQQSFIKVPVLPNTTYAFSCEGSSEVYLRAEDGAGALTQLHALVGSGSRIITTVANTKFLNIRVDNGPNVANVILSKPMLTLGNKVKPFVPKNPSYLFANVKLGSIGDKKDILWRDGQDWKVRWEIEKDVVLDGSLAWNYHDDATGYKRFKLPRYNGLNTLLGYTNSVISKHDGSLLKPKEITDSANQYRHISGDTVMYTTVSDIDTGFTETYTPTSDEIKAYFNGWKVKSADVSTGKPSAWKSIVDGTDAPIQTLVYVSSNLAPNYTPYKLSYVLATPVTEVVTDKVEGDLVVNGLTQVEVGAGVIVREKVTSKFFAGSSTYLLNYTGSPSSYTNNKPTRYLGLYKNNSSAPFRVDNLTANGVRLAVDRADFDTTAEYTVTYIALDKEKMTTNPVSVPVSWAGSLKSAVDDVVVKQSDIATNVSILFKLTSELLRAVKGLEGA